MTERGKTRVRVNLKRSSVKEGYRPDFTVEVEWNGDHPESDEEGLYRLGSLINMVEREAFHKANEMNVREGFPIVNMDRKPSGVTSEVHSFPPEVFIGNGADKVSYGIDEETGEIFP